MHVRKPQDKHHPYENSEVLSFLSCIDIGHFAMTNCDDLSFQITTDFDPLINSVWFLVLNVFVAFQKHSHSQSQRCVYGKPLGILHYRSA